MYRITLCDDEMTELDRLENMLKLYCRQHIECEFSIERFQNADDMLHRIVEEKCVPDLLLLDIFMQGKLGTEAARELRDKGIECGILFLTSSTGHALEAFRVDAVQYLVKPISDQDLFPVLDRFIKDIEVKKKYILLRDHGIKRLNLLDIVYCEAQKKSQHIYLADGTQLIQNMTMAKLYEMLSVSREFVKVGGSYIVNLAHIDHLNAREVRMDNGQTIYLPRGAYRNLREQYFDYYCGEEER